MTRARTARHLGPLALLTLSAAGCVGADGTLPTTTSVVESPTSTTGSTTTAPAVEQQAVSSYLLLDAMAPDEGGPHLVPMQRAQPAADVETALEALLTGPPPVGDPRRSTALTTAVPEGTQLLGVSMEGATAAVDLSGAFASGGGSSSVLARLPRWSSPPPTSRASTTSASASTARP